MISRFAPFLLLLLAFVLYSCGSDEEQRRFELEGKVVRIADGDTFTLLADGRRQVKVRMHGIDCPERAQDFGSVARQRTSALIFGKNVRLDIKDEDRYGRQVALVYTDDGLCVNEVLLQEGLAWHYTAYDQNPDWARLQSNAKQQRLGLWSGKEPVAPWQFRKLN